ncbi:MAG: hypothetical protein QM537_09315 [Candidatus Symbiobacter sp.]|nr:hypothetical protein [Candidatus Symbiobacter sp.]
MVESKTVPRQLLLHASCVARQVKGEFRGILLRGPSGRGKSDLALRLIHAGWQLVADDQTILMPMAEAEAGGSGATAYSIMANCPPAILGLIEIRGVGLLKIPAVLSARVVALFDLLPHSAIERYPDEAEAKETFFGIALPKWGICGYDASAVAKIEVTLSHKGLI